eukprot:scaffold744_cov111-Isochrysis_galbana.AAC.7
MTHDGMVRAAGRSASWISSRAARPPPEVPSHLHLTCAPHLCSLNLYGKRMGESTSLHCPIMKMAMIIRDVRHDHPRKNADTPPSAYRADAVAGMDLKTRCSTSPCMQVLTVSKGWLNVAAMHPAPAAPTNDAALGLEIYPSSLSLSANTGPMPR